MAENQTAYQEIWVNVILPDQRERANNLVKWSWRWRKIQNWIESIGRVLQYIAAILAFAAGVYDNSLLAFISGSVCATGSAFNQFSLYAGKESAERKTDLIQLLHEIKASDLEPPLSLNGDIE